MRDIDSFNWSSILENAKTFMKWAIELISAQLPFRCVFLRISKKLTKITEHFHYILKILLIFLYDFKRAE